MSAPDIEDYRRMLREMVVWTVGVTTDATATQAERIADGADCWPDERRRPMRGSMLDRAIRLLNENR